MGASVRRVLVMFAVSAIPRLLGAFFLPNTFGDAYVYIRDIGALSTKIKSGTFAITDLYGFWLPLYQFISALVNVFIGNGFYVGKVVSAIFGTGVCLLVCAITIQVVKDKNAALLSFLLIALNPLHILNSASAMTDVPHAFFVLACLFFVIKGRWIVAATFAALAGLTRVESWMLIALLPLVQLWKERRVSMPAVLVMLFPPAFWFYVSSKATGDWLATFKVRQQYHDWLLAQNPALSHSSIDVLKDVAMLLSGADVAVLCGAFVAGWLVVRRFTSRDFATGRFDSILPPLIFFFAFFALLLLAYLTHQQPIIFPRYGLILFSLGIPILAWTYFAITTRRPGRSRRLLAAIATLCVLNWLAQFVGGVGELNRYAAQRQAADYLYAHFRESSNRIIFCDEGSVQALSGLPADRFISSATAPHDRDDFIRFLNDQNVGLLVYVKRPGSTLSNIFPDAESVEPEEFDQVAHSYSNFLPLDVRVFKRRKS